MSVGERGRPMSLLDTETGRPEFTWQESKIRLVGFAEAVHGYVCTLFSIPPYQVIICPVGVRGQ